MTVASASGAPRRQVGDHLLGHGLCLHPVERVEGGQQGDVELVLDGVAGQPREPVVGVHGVVLAAVLVGDRCAARRGHGAQDTVGELGHERLELLLGHRRQRPGRHPVDDEARLDEDVAELVRRLGPGEDVAAASHPCERRGQLADVDVHPAAVTGARLGQR